MHYPRQLAPLDAAFRRYQRKGDPRALTTVFDQAAPEMLRVARGFARGDEAMAEDAVQSAFLTAIEKADTFDGKRRVMPWLLGLLARELRRERASAQRTPNPAWLKEGAELRSPGDPKRMAADAELKALIKEKVEELPETYRTAVRQHLFSDASSSSRAADLDITPGTLHVRVHRGLGLLKSLLPASAALSAGLVIAKTRGLAAQKAAILGAQGGKVATGSGAGAAASATAGVAASRLTIAAASVASLVLGGTGAVLWQGQQGTGTIPQARELAAVDAPHDEPAKARDEGLSRANSRIDRQEPLRLAAVNTSSPTPDHGSLAGRARVAEQPPMTVGTPRSRDEWLADYQAAEGYTAIASLGLELARLPDDLGLSLALWIYPQLRPAQRKQFAKPFIFQEGTAYGLDIVDAVARDADPDVQEYAWSFLEPFAFRNFSDEPVAYPAWYDSVKDLTRAEAMVKGAHSFSLRCARAVDDETLAATLNSIRPASDRTFAAIGLVKTALFDGTDFRRDVLGWTASPNAAVAQASLAWLSHIGTNETEYRFHVIPLLDGPDSATAREAAKALALSRQPFAMEELSARFGGRAGPTPDESLSPEFWIDWTGQSH